MNALRFFLLRLTDPQVGCPRRWFFPLILGLYLLLPPLHLMLAGAASGMNNICLKVLATVGLVAASLPMPLLNEGRYYVTRALWQNAADASAATGDTPWLLVLIISALLLISLLMLALVWFRLRDAGLRPIYMLFGLVPAPVLLMGTSDAWTNYLASCTAWGLSVILFVIYCFPTRKREEAQAEPPKEPALPAADAEPAAAADDCGLSPAPEPLRLNFPHKGRVLCVLFILVQFVLLQRMSFGVEGGLFFLIFLGLVPALLLLFPAKKEETCDRVLRAIAIAALYAVFIPFLFLFNYWADMGPQGAISIFYTYPFAHILWLLLALPWLIRRCLPALRSAPTE